MRMRDEAVCDNTAAGVPRLVCERSGSTGNNDGSDAVPSIVRTAITARAAETTGLTRLRPGRRARLGVRAELVLGGLLVDVTMPTANSIRATPVTASRSASMWIRPK